MSMSGGMSNRRTRNSIFIMTGWHNWMKQQNEDYEKKVTIFLIQYITYSPDPTTNSYSARQFSRKVPDQIKLCKNKLLFLSNWSKLRKDSDLYFRTWLLDPTSIEVRSKLGHYLPHLIYSKALFSSIHLYFFWLAIHTEIFRVDSYW